MARLDYSIIGKRFGKLVVVDFDHMGGHGSSYWLCECDCGGNAVVNRKCLISGNTRSCGCLRPLNYDTELLGKKFERLYVVKFDHMDDHGRSYWLCECECGKKLIVRRESLLTGHTKSCGCYKLDKLSERETTHGMSNTRLYNTWQAIKDRCLNKNNSRYNKYGGQGIKMCNEWDDFITFYDWAAENGYTDDLTIDRIDNDGDYCPENCRWVDNLAQQNNKGNNRFVTYLDSRHTIAEWARIMNISDCNLRYHINHNNISDFAEYFGKIDPYWHEG